MRRCACLGNAKFAIQPLALPDPHSLPPPEQLGDYEAVRLFIERGSSVRPQLALSGDQATAVAEICARLDGLPLAIELAAARLRVLSPQVLLERLEQSLPLLVGGPRDMPARQQTLTATISWSYDLLDPAEQRLFRRISVFVGGFTFEAAEAVCGDADLGLAILDGLESLLAKSLLGHHEGDQGTPRFRMLETVREYALEQASAAGGARRVSPPSRGVLPETRRNGGVRVRQCQMRPSGCSDSRPTTTICARH